MPENDYVVAETVADWLKGGKVTSAIVGEVASVDVGPAVLEPTLSPKNLNVINTVMVSVKVTES